MTTTSRLYYDPARQSAFSTLRKILSGTTTATARKDTSKPGAKKKSVDTIRAWLEKQYAYTLHRPVRKRFVRNPYTVTNVMNVWECDLLDVQTYAKYKDNHRYNVSLIDVYPKFLYMIPAKTKREASVVSAFRSIYDDPKYSSRRRSIWVRNDKGNEFLIKYFQDML